MYNMRFQKWFLEFCNCMDIPEDEYKRENTHDTIVPSDFIPVNAKLSSKSIRFRLSI